MILQAGQEVVKTGTFQYDGQITCDVRIVRGPNCYGSSDCEEPSDIADDHKRETFYIQYGSTTERGRYNAGGGGYLTLSDAIAVVEAAPGFGCTVRWAD
jgi:hypothetical protein